MSFDVFYCTCNLGNRTAERVNPFTGQTQLMTVDDGLTDTERAAVRKLLQAAGASEPDGFGCYLVAFRDGGAAEVFASNLEGPEQCDGLMVTLRSLTPELVKFLWDLSQVGNMFMEDEVVAVASEEQRRRIESRWPAAAVVGSPDELGRLLGNGVAAWQAYRDQVIGKEGEAAENRN